MLKIAITVVIAVAALFGARASGRGQDYLELGNSSRVPTPSRDETIDTPDGRRDVAVVPYRDGARVAYGFSVRNDGPFSVKVTEIQKPEAPGASRFMFRPVAVRMAGREGPETRATGPFRPFTLKKDHQRYVDVVGQLGNCEGYNAGSGEFIDSQPVQFKVLGQTLTDSIKLPTRVSIEITRSTRCPR